MKNVIKLAKGSLNNIFQDSFNKILSQQITHDRSYISVFDRVKLTCDIFDNSQNLACPYMQGFEIYDWIGFLILSLGCATQILTVVFFPQTDLLQNIFTCDDLFQKANRLRDFSAFIAKESG